MGFRLPDRRHIASTVKDQRLAFIDALVIVALLGLALWAVKDLNLFEMLYTFTRDHEDAQIDEYVIVALFSVVGLFVFGARRLQDQRREIKARQRAEDRAQHLALADALTGLPNRRQFGARLSAAIGAPSAGSRSVAVMMIDLDRFKPVNDVFGHSIGDRVLIAFARRATAIAGPDAVLARLGGDEFALLLEQLADTEEPARIARRLLALFEQPFAVADVQVTLGASIGIAISPQDGNDPEDLMRRADIALYRAKHGRGSFRFFEAEMDAQVKRRAAIERDLRLAIVDGTVRPHYQAIVDLTTGRITGFEALARWHHPEFGDLEPEHFIAIAEDAGLIIPLSSALLRMAARDAMDWPADVKLSFNISRVQLADPMMVLRILQILGETGLSPTRLEVEISEQALVADILAAQQALGAFHQAGVRIALDDFGTGNSSLQHLRACHFDRLKIDRSFVMAMASSAEEASLVNAMLGLSKALGLAVTAEGIEDSALIAELRDGGCSEGQGFTFGKALPALEVLALLGVQTPQRAMA